ncbi:MAG: enoyl-CoA hydratase [Thermoplasmata archaeon]|jgi:enoyl-CoA hydratase|nr:enoyl-CoA hydratase [Thermoplasmata archaeon]
MSVRASRDGPVVTILLDRPDVRNAVDRATAQALADAFRAFEADPATRVAVLSGEDGTFCAGADLKAIAAGNGNRIEPEGDGPMGPTRMLPSKPVIAAVEGHAVGGGFELALWCDLRVVAEGATLGFFNRAWGVPLIDGGTVRLPRLIGLSRALDLILTGRAIDAHEALTGRAIDAHEALALGVANRVVPRGQALAAAQALAREIAQHPPRALAGDRLAAHEGFGLPWEAALRNELARGQDALAHETAEGARRFSRRKR